MQVGCYGIEIYFSFSNKETVDFLLNNVNIKFICVQFVNIPLIYTFNCYASDKCTLIAL